MDNVNMEILEELYVHYLTQGYDAEEAYQKAYEASEYLASKTQAATEVNKHETNRQQIIQIGFFAVVILVSVIVFSIIK